MFHVSPTIANQFCQAICVRADNFLQLLVSTILSVPHETNGQDQITPDHVTVASVSLSALLKAKICSRSSKTSMDETFIGTYPYKLHTCTSTFGTSMVYVSSS